MQLIGSVVPDYADIQDGYSKTEGLRDCNFEVERSGGPTYHSCLAEYRT